MDNNIKVVDLEYECKAVTYIDSLRRMCDIIPDTSSKEMCYLVANTDKIVFIDANNYSVMGKGKYKSYGEVYCFDVQELYAVMMLPVASKRDLTYILVSKVYGNMIEWKILLLRYSDKTYVILKKEGSRRILKSDVEKLVEAIDKLVVSQKPMFEQRYVTSLYK